MADAARTIMSDECKPASFFFSNPNLRREGGVAPFPIAMQNHSGAAWRLRTTEAAGIDSIRVRATRAGYLRSEPIQPMTDQTEPGNRGTATTLCYAEFAFIVPRQFHLDQDKM